MAIQPSQPQTIGAVLDTTFQLYKASLARVIPLCLLLAVASSPPSFYLMTQGGVASSTNPLATLQAMQNPTYWLIYVISSAAVMWVIGALYVKINAIGTAADIGIGTALQAALGRLPALILTTILFMIAVMIGSILLVVPGLILMVSLMLGFNLVMFEGKGPVEALKSSHRLVWGNWWRAAGVLTVGFIISMVIYMLAGVLMGAVMPIVGFDNEDLFMASMLSGLIIGALMSMLVTPFFTSLAIALYWDLKLRKEGGDLEARVDALSAA